MSQREWKDYYQCSDSGCEKYFSDAACTATISDLDTWKTGDGKIAKTGHKQIHILQKDATTQADGYKEHKAPSVTPKDLREYERMRSLYSPKDANVRMQRIGF